MEQKPADLLRWSDVVNFARQGNPQPQQTTVKSDAEWREILPNEVYQVMRQHGTERPFSSNLCSLFEPGEYACAACGQQLFDAHEKFESGTGWPSFTQPTKIHAIAYHEENRYGMQRIETTCNSCGSHLGHVFPDGPPPSGLRYCMNAVALKKQETS